MGWGVFSWPGRVQGRGVAPCPLRGDLGEIRVFAAVAGEGLAWGCEWSGVPDQDTGPFLRGAARSGQAAAEAGALLGASPRGLPVQPPGPAPKNMGFPRRVTSLPLAMPLAWYGALSLFPSLGAGPPTPQRESPLRGGSGLMGTEPVPTVCVGAGDWDRGLGGGAGLA